MRWVARGLTACAGTLIAFSGFVAGVTYAWTRPRLTLIDSVRDRVDPINDTDATGDRWDHGGMTWEHGNE